ncbi:helix-turn-helix domain-containing protein [Candidatus Bipolaricaulota bacterium]
MTPKRDAQDMLFSVAEAARILGMKRQAVYAAINANRLKATDETYGKKVKASDLIAYGIRAGRDPKDLVDEIQKETEAGSGEVLLWVLAGLGIGMLLGTLLDKLTED